VDELNVAALLASQHHSGALGGGHYTAFGKNPNGNWYHFNDEKVTLSNPEAAMNSGAYVLFYAQSGLEVNAM
jgi:ubiquitin C-terminal hydrolase